MLIDFAPFLENITLQAQAGVHGSAGKQGRHHGEQGGGNAHIHAHAIGKNIGATIHKGSQAALTKGCVYRLPVSQGGKTGGGGNDGCQCQRAFAHSTEIAHEAGIGFLVQLLGAGAGGDQTMEAGDGAASDGDKQKR